MTLRKKTVLIFGTTLFGLIAIFYITSRIILLGSFARLEEKNMRQNVDSVLDTLSSSLSVLNSKTGDWASWDETYAFIKNAGQDFIKRNLTDNAFNELRLNLMLYIDSSGSVVFGKAFNLQDQTEAPIPKSLKKHIASDNIMLQHTYEKSSLTGILNLPEGPMLIASRPILTSEGKGPIRGTLIFGRYLDAAEIKHLSETTNLVLTAYRLDDPQMPSDFQSVRFRLSEKMHVIVRPLDKQSVSGYSLLKDIYGKPAIILRADTGRDIYRQGQDSFYFFIFSSLAVGIVLSIVTLFLMEKQVLSRITSLIRNVGIIGTSGNLSMRVQMKGKDEIARLSEEMNRMFETIEKADNALRDSEEKYRLIVQNAHEAIVVAQEGRLKFVNPQAVALIGYSKEELTSRGFMEFIHPEDQDLVAERYRRRLKGEDVPSVYSFRIVDQYGNIKWVEINALKTTWEGETATLNFISDITKRKQLEEELRTMSLRDEMTSLYNRRGFVTLAEQQLKIANRVKKGMLMIFADLDGLKQINDTFGHQEGDRALIDFASILKKTFRESDIIARYGGDEFVILSLETPEFGVDIMIKRLREQLSYYNRYENRPYSLSLSMGFARFDPENPLSLHDLLVKADNMMYEQKKAGKDS
jgi:diguanylate cyclase (GGDEF)-like protein/PAS domain S-box-containing protein